ncbi:hypothetical protein RHSIM_Rhsim04G0165200 [Rhododendron simsii]|uniref:Membrane-bound O-acyltransferase C24H6.01c n=1 Tax=Rhododendron simsii TaxID=118357 RepID=A0A834H5F7_RHOSS|nr:hypothetical protein RHSIM_Rhsim04G0165200 [Rhododendron simsii]
MNNSSWQHRELICLILYAFVFYVIIIRRSLHLSHDHYGTLYGLRPGWIGGWYNDVSDAQWRNFRANLPILTVVFGIFTMAANMMRAFYHLKAKGMSIVWLLISLAYLLYLHGACIIFVLSIAAVNLLLVKIFGKKKYFPFVLWGFNISVLICNRVFEGYRFSSIGQHWAYLDNFRGTFRWHICFNFVTLCHISFGYDYHWACCSSWLDQKKHIQSCPKCSSGQTCYLLLQSCYCLSNIFFCMNFNFPQERNLQNNNFSLAVYLCYLVYAPLYIAGPVLSFNTFASQLDTPQKNYSLREVAWYGLRWVFSLLLMELMTHLFYYNAFAISGLWKQLSPMDVFIIGYGVLNFMWLKFSLIWLLLSNF